LLYFTENALKESECSSWWKFCVQSYLDT